MQMPLINEVQNRRDAALHSWRRELGLLKFCQPGSPQWTQHRMVVERARAIYSTAANEYTDMLVGVDRPNQDAA
jgi:hypothetical protein